MMMIEDYRSGAIPGLYHGIYNLGGETDKTSMWNGLTVSKAYMKAVGGEPLIISCYLGGCIIHSESNNVVSTSDVGGPFQAAPVPIPAAAWLFMSGLISLVWKGRKARKSFY